MHDITYQDWLQHIRIVWNIIWPVAISGIILLTLLLLTERNAMELTPVEEARLAELQGQEEKSEADAAELKVLVDKQAA